MDASTRPPQKRHRAAAQMARSLVAIFFLGATSFATSNSADDGLPIAATPRAQATAHDIAIATVKSGQEGLELSARFSESQTELVQDVHWNILNADGTTVFDGLATTADAALPPGDYKIAASYGTAQIQQNITLQTGTRISVSFVLNAGGLRILPRIADMDAPRLTSRSFIYVLSGDEKGKLITTSQTPGEILKLNTGTYRIENRFEGSNAVAVTDVQIKSGMMSAVEISHHAGVANLNYKSAIEHVTWTITSDDGTELPPAVGKTFTLVLKAGHYSAKATTSNSATSINFNVTNGHSSFVELGQ